MKKVILISLIVMLNFNILYANNFAKGALVLGVISAIANANTKSYDYIADDKNYELNKTYNITSTQNLINVKNGVGVKEKVILIKKISLNKNDTLLINKTMDGNILNNDIPFIRIKPNTEEILQGKIGKKLYAKFDSDGILLSTEYKPLQSEIGKVFFKKGKVYSILKDTFSQELVYTGNDGHKLFLLYREYIGNMIRSPFIQNLVFDLSKSKILNIGKYTIEIIKANNQGLQYKVLNDTNL